MTTPDPNEIAKQAREHAWNWFALHATQRMQAFNFFVVATAFLIAAYASILEKHPAAAAVLALVGAWLTFWFNRLDARSYQLVEAGEDALRVSQARLASLADNQSLMILDAVDEPAPGASSYRRVITVIQSTIFALFLLGALYAIRLSLMWCWCSSARQQTAHPASGVTTITTSLADGTVVARIMKAAAAPVGTPRLWPMAYGHHEDRTPTHGYAATSEAAAMAAFAKSWRREWKARFWIGRIYLRARLVVLQRGSLPTRAAGATAPMFDDPDAMEWCSRRQQPLNGALRRWRY
jgi:hypothetical protein